VNIHRAVEVDKTLRFCSIPVLTGTATGTKADAEGSAEEDTGQQARKTRDVNTMAAVGAPPRSQAVVQLR